VEEIVDVDFVGVDGIHEIMSLGMRVIGEGEELPVEFARRVVGHHGVGRDGRGAGRSVKAVNSGRE
jgi:hypothetical protein